MKSKKDSGATLREGAKAGGEEPRGKLTRKEIPYKSAPREKVGLPKRQKPGDYVEPDYPVKLIEARY